MERRETMARKNSLTIAGLVVLLGVSFGVYFFFVQAGEPPLENPWDSVPKRVPGTEHTSLIKGPFKNGPSVTEACLSCHESAAREVMATAHWTWSGHKVKDPESGRVVALGKRNAINNYCIGIQSNWPMCTTCHAGYGWSDDTFDFSSERNVDCLVCHDRTGTYRKAPGKSGHPAEEVDLTAVAQSVSYPTRENCGYCHFSGGGGDAVKHGDMDGTMYFPTERIDVHMGRLDFACQDCHRTVKHLVPGESMSFGVEDRPRVHCTDCHAARPHRQERLNEHNHTVACQSCHVPRMAVAQATKMSWDWSAAGQDLDVEDPHVYLKKKGRFTFASNAIPEYYWFNGSGERYLQGQKIDPEKINGINRPLGNIDDPQAKIWPFKVHRGIQIYDRKYRYLLVPKTYGQGGYWTEFDWDLAARLGSQATGLAYSGEYGFVRTEMFWVLTHMVSTLDKVLQCTDCHGEGDRIDWQRLGYEGDPAFRTGRLAARLYPVE